jgi:xanthine dehydrogenase accessory factor
VKGVLPEVIAWLGEGRPVALARVVEVVGSGVQAAGAALAVNADGQVAGSASGGCVEGALVLQTRAALTDDGRPRVASFGCTDDEAFDVGLTCGGTVRVLIERLEPPVPWLDALDKVLVAGTGAALVEVVDGPPGQLGAKVVVGEDGAVIFPALAPGSLAPGPLAPGALDDALADLAAGRSATHRYETGRGPDEAAVTLFVDSFAAPPRMVIFGAASFTAALTAQAKLLGYRVVVCDARAVFASKARFPLADEVVVDWPNRYLAQHGAGLGPRDAICVLNHDPKFDLPALMGALATSVGYIGALGSRRTQADRRRRLAEAGAGDADIARIRGPLGLDLGAGSAEETALSICAEIVTVRTGRSGASLASHSGPIHVVPPETQQAEAQQAEAQQTEARS